MQVPDLINGGFEIFSSIMVLNHCRVLLKDKSVRGVSIVSNMFFVAWGGWNLYYYPHLGQTLSFYGGIAIMLANALWVGLMFRYRRGPLPTLQAT